ncbi:histone-lysine N-methyltransferase SETMAR [Trichonephila clavata]|uniref:Histone-lysine N-methyltransferase SETMAR n=1 Tax=Trichonephila clavata TaxID=2740835 RepID=A0A8X6JAY1_TRICU|nr:histone-lysine N-methyltransferase SETMAR [Trichonephila clavata]
MVSHIQCGRQQVQDRPRAGRTHTATTDANVGKVDGMIRANRRITIDEVAEELGISHGRAQNIIHDILRYRKVSARWVPRQLTSTHQEQRMAVSLDHLVCYHEDGNDFLFRIVTRDETKRHVSLKVIHPCFVGGFQSCIRQSRVSYAAPQALGLPQLAVLNCLLFNILIDDLETATQNVPGVSFFFFADDVVI